MQQRKEAAEAATLIDQPSPEIGPQQQPHEDYQSPPELLSCRMRDSGSQHFAFRVLSRQASSASQQVRSDGPEDWVSAWNEEGEAQRRDHSAFSARRPGLTLNMDLITQPQQPTQQPFAFSLMTPLSAHGDYFQSQVPLISPNNVGMTPHMNEPIMLTPLGQISPIALMSNRAGTPHVRHSLFTLPLENNN